MRTLPCPFRNRISSGGRGGLAGSAARNRACRCRRVAPRSISGRTAGPVSLSGRLSRPLPHLWAGSESRRLPLPGGRGGSALGRSFRLASQATLTVFVFHSHARRSCRWRYRRESTQRPGGIPAGLIGDCPGRIWRAVRSATVRSLPTRSARIAATIAVGKRWLSNRRGEFFRREAASDRGGQASVFFRPSSGIFMDPWTAGDGHRWTPVVIPGRA